MSKRFRSHDVPHVNSPKASCCKGTGHVENELAFHYMCSLKRDLFTPDLEHFLYLFITMVLKRFSFLDDNSHFLLLPDLKENLKSKFSK